MTTVLGVDVGGTAIKAVLLTGTGRVIRRWRWDTNAADGPRAVTTRILDAIGEAIAGGEARAVGVAVAGLVDEAAGVAVASENLGWRDWPVTRLVTERTGLRAWLGHDVRSGALAESRLGAGRGYPDLVFVAVGTGVGAAHVAASTVRPGRHGLAGEIGHLVVDPDGPQCACGKGGCVEAIGSAAALQRAYLLESGDPLTAEQILQLHRRGNQLADQLWQAAIDALARGVAAAIVVLDPEAVVIGGGLAAAGSTLLHPLRRALAGQLTGLHMPPLHAAELGAWAGAVGAALHAHHQLGHSLSAIPARTGNTERSSTCE
jgi:glucokinase